MKVFSIILVLLAPIFCYCQNVGINTTNPSERLHILDNSSTKLLLKTSNGTSFFTADSPSNSGLVFRTGGLDKGVFFYSPFSNSISTSIGLNGWTLFSNGDFRVKERIYSVEDLRLDATEQVTIEANGSTIVIDPNGSITIQGNQVTIAATEDLIMSAKNISISAETSLQVSSGGSSSYEAGSAMDILAGNDIQVVTPSDISVLSQNLDVEIAGGSSLVSGTELSISSTSLSLNTFSNANFSVGNNFMISTAKDLDIAVGSNYELDVAKDYSLAISQDYDLSASSIFNQSSGPINLAGNIIKLNNGAKALARIGDSVVVDGKVGVITAGSTTIFGN